MFLHALGVAHGVTVLIIQAGMDAGIVGLDVVEDAVMEGRGRAMVVPVALQNDKHFFGVTQIDAGADLSTSG